MHVLSVDDDGDTLDIVRAILEDAGAVVTTASSAREGLEMLQRERPAVLVSDMVMPTEDGFWLIAQVRGLAPAHGGRTPAAALTALTGAADRAQILGAGFQYQSSSASSRSWPSRSNQGAVGLAIGKRFPTATRYRMDQRIFRWSRPGSTYHKPNPMSRPASLRFRPIDLNDIHVLVVDDHDDTVELFSSALHVFGAKVLTARTARNALTIIKTVRVNAMVSDLAMPGEDGLWLIQQLRRLKYDQGGSIPAIAVTAHRDRYAADRVTALGFEAFLTKPVDPFDVCSAVASLVGR